MTTPPPQADPGISPLPPPLLQEKVSPCRHVPDPNGNSHSVMDFIKYGGALPGMQPPVPPPPGQRAWVWHVLKWVGERLVEELGGAARPWPGEVAPEGSPDTQQQQQQQGGEGGASPGGKGSRRGRGGGGGRRGGGAGADSSRDVSPGAVGGAVAAGPAAAAGGAAGAYGGVSEDDPRRLVVLLVERVGEFRGPELLPLAQTLLEVVMRGEAAGCRVAWVGRVRRGNTGGATGRRGLWPIGGPGRPHGQGLGMSWVEVL